tara:strand:+ start:4789 stop:6063 length:1275 start_codon:yes stop_codon:yes gene_type:complete
MEIRDPVHGNIDIDPRQEQVMQHPVYQRLRQIKQLGFGEFSFPGATHNRYMHSLGASFLSAKIFDSIFNTYPFANDADRLRLRDATILAALLHDIGHGPLSHTTEEVMPQLRDLAIPAYKDRPDRQANHEDYTIKFITDSDLKNCIEKNYKNLPAIEVAKLIDKTIENNSNYFIVDGLDFRPLLSQLISSELDADRMDYLQRDSYFSGTNYGAIDMEWIINNLSYHIVDDRLHLALGRRALYTFDNFLISRHHMYLQVYFHHKSIIYDEILNRYLTDPECAFALPADIDEYLLYTDYLLYEHLRTSKNYWANLIAKRQPYKVLFELHSMADSNRVTDMQKQVEDAGISTIYSNSKTRLSKYHATSPKEHKIHSIYVIDEYDKKSPVIELREATEIFKMYEGIRRIERLYVPPENLLEARKVLSD